MEVGDTVDLVNRKDLEKDKPATDQRTAGDSGVAAVADDVDRAPTAKTDEPIDRPASGRLVCHSTHPTKQMVCGAHKSLGCVTDMQHVHGCCRFLTYETTTELCWL